MDTITIILVVLFIIGLILLFRELTTWYFKLNKIVDLLEKQNKLIEDLMFKMRWNGK